MATMNENFFAELLSPKAAKWSAGVAFDRSNGLPLDQWSVFQTKTAAEEYLSNSKAYPGQVIAYAEADGSMTACVLSQNAEGTALTLKQIGIIPSGDAATIEVTADGKISIYGFGDATTGYLPRKGEDGKLEWVPISAVVQGDGNKITTLTSEDGSVTITKKTDTDTSLVYDLSVTHPDMPEYAVKKDERAEGATETTYHLTKGGESVDVAIVVPDAYNDTELAGRVTDLENNKADKSTTYTKTEVDEAIDAAVEGILGEDVKEAYNTLKEIQDLLEGTDGEAIDGLIEVADANKQAIEVLNGDANTAGSVDAKIAAAVAPLATTEALNGVKATAEAAQTAEEVSEAINTALADYTDTETLNGLLDDKVDDVDLANYYTKEEADDKYAVATDVARDYATKQEITDAGYAVAETVNGELAKKLEKVTIAHTSEDVAEGVTYSEDGKTANVVVDAYLKSEVYTKGETDTAITNKIKEFTGGESAADVLLALNDYKKANDTEIYGATKVAEWTDAEGKYTPDYTKDSRIDANHAATQANAQAINNIAVLVGTIGEISTTTLAGKIGALEAHDAAHAIEFNELNGKVGQNTQDIAKRALAENTYTKGEVDALLVPLALAANVYTKDEADGKFLTKADYTPYDDTAIKKLISDEAARADAEEKRIVGLVADEAARADAAEKVNAKAIADEVARADAEEKRIVGLVEAEATRADKAEKANKALIDELDVAVKANAGEITRVDNVLKAALENDGEGLDSIKELADWINKHGTAAEDMVKAIEKNAADITNIYTPAVGEEEASGLLVEEVARIDGVLAGHKTAIETTLPSAIAKALEDAKKYADDQDAIALAAAKKYTDDTMVKADGVTIENKEGTFGVKAISTDLLVQGEIELVLNGGNAALN